MYLSSYRLIFLYSYILIFSYSYILITYPIVNPYKPEGGFKIDMSRWDERQIGKILIHLSVEEAGENCTYCTLLFFYSYILTLCSYILIFLNSYILKFLYSVCLALLTGIITCSYVCSHLYVPSISSLLIHLLIRFCLYYAYPCNPPTHTLIHTPTPTHTRSTR
jgi:hypothetical protein